MKKSPERKVDSFIFAQNVFIERHCGGTDMCDVSQKEAQRVHYQIGIDKERHSHIKAFILKEHFLCKDKNTHMRKVGFFHLMVSKYSETCYLRPL